MIAAIEWVPVGVAAEHPKKYEMNNAEKEVLKMLQEQEEEAGESPPPKPSISSKLPKVENNLPADLRMDEYSDDDEEDGAAVGNLLVADDDEERVGDSALEEAGEKEGTNMDQEDDDDMDSDDDDNLEDVPDTREYTPLDVEGLQAMGFGDAGGFGDANEMFNEDDDSDADDVRITPDDAVLVLAKTEDDFASLEVHVYDTKRGSLYTHHDIPLPSFPLCLAHGQVVGEGGSGNFCAVGTFDPGIEIWNLDVLNALEPTFVLGGEDTTMADAVMKENLLRASSGQKLKKPPRAGSGEGASLRPGSHTGAVMGLSWNQVHRHVIASGSADNTVKIWDVSLAGSGDGNKANAGTFTHHKDKVQAVQWHPVEATILATGSYDRTVALLDARDSAGSSIKKVKTPSDCEALEWDPFRPELLTVACEDGTIMCWDVRKFTDKSPVWSFVANEFGGISDISYNRHVPGMMATCSIDKTVALWDTHNQDDNSNTNFVPRNCGSKDMKVGKLYTVGFYPSSPWLLGCGGSENNLALWDMSSEDALQARFGKRLDGGEEKGEGQETDFEAAMAKNDAENEASKSRSSSSNNNNKKKKGKGKKKTHKRGR